MTLCDECAAGFCTQCLGENVCDCEHWLENEPELEFIDDDVEGEQADGQR